MDREVIEQKLESLRRCLKRIETKCPANAEILASDFDLQDILALNLSRAIQLDDFSSFAKVVMSRLDAS